MEPFNAMIWIVLTVLGLWCAVGMYISVRGLKGLRRRPYDLGDLTAPHYPPGCVFCVHSVICNEGSRAEFITKYNRQGVILEAERRLELAKKFTDKHPRHEASIMDQFAYEALIEKLKG